MQHIGDIAPKAIREIAKRKAEAEWRDADIKARVCRSNGEAAFRKALTQTPVSFKELATWDHAMDQYQLALGDECAKRRQLELFDDNK